MLHRTTISGVLVLGPFQGPSWFASCTQRGTFLDLQDPWQDGRGALQNLTMQ